MRSAGRIRRSFWVILTGALLLALALPLIALHSSADTSLHARACVWPIEPRAQTTAQILVVAPEATDRADLQNPQTVVHVTLNGPNGSVAPEQMRLSGPPRQMNGAAVFSIPISVPEPGAWTAQVRVEAPGRPVWRDTIAFTVGDADWNALPLGTQPALPDPVCPVGPPS